MANVDPSVVLIQLLLAHIVVDFFIQPKSWIDDRRKRDWHSRKLYYHSILAGIVPFILLGSFDNWPIVPVFAFTHLIIDGVKCRYEDNFKVFVVDQGLHFVVIILVWLLAFNAHLTIDQIVSEVSSIWSNLRVCLVLLGGGILTIPASIFIGKVMKRWEPEGSKGLEDAGRLIGVAERIIVFTLIMVSQFTVIGFVIATKSIFRLKDGSERAEYYLVGSMLSFSIAIATGLIIQYLVGLGA